MLIHSQPLAPKFSEKMGLNKIDEEMEFSEKRIKKQYIGKMFDDLFDEDNERKISISTRISWKWRHITDFYYNTKYAIRNHFKWRKTIRGLRPWEGFSGLISVMQTHLADYIETEEKYGHSEENYKKNKIATAKEALEIIKRMKEPGNYSDKRRNEVEMRYPDYKTLNANYVRGGSSSSGDFIEQGKGWAGIEGGNDPRKGYFEFFNGRLELAESPDQIETDRLLAQIEEHREELRNAYEQANVDFESDVDRLGQLFKENLYSWWD